MVVNDSIRQRGQAASKEEHSEAPPAASQQASAEAFELVHEEDPSSLATIAFKGVTLLLAVLMAVAIISYATVRV